MSRGPGRYGPLTVAKYVEFEAASPVRHDYIDGFLYELEEVSNRHAGIVVNLIAALLRPTRRTGHHLHTRKIRVRVSNTRYYYPDLHIVASKPAATAYEVTNPCVIVEVQSPTSEVTDQREKLDAYRMIESLRSYVIVHQNHPTVEQHWLDEGVWRHAIYQEGAVLVPCLDLELPLATIYEDVVFAPS